MRNKLTQKSNGFTLVELMIVIAIIATLATVAAISYRGVKQNNAESNLNGDLAQAALQMENAKARIGDFPTELPATVEPSEAVSLELLVNDGPSRVQYGVLFHEVCQDLLDEGYGEGTNAGGGTEQYITDCEIYNYTDIHIDGWNSNDFGLPIYENTLRDWYNENVDNESWFPDKKTVAVEFADELSARYQSLGGVFPINTFWDAWANASNGGVEYEPLPESGNLLLSSKPEFCIEAVHQDYPDMIWHVRSNGMPVEGEC